MGDDDERWYAFGFDKPSDSASPELEVTVTGHNAVGESSPTAPVTGVLP